MSCSMTVEAVRDRSKTVTRRHVDTWMTLTSGDRLTLIERGMGLKAGQKQVVLAEVEIVSVRSELLLAGLSDAELAAEGFDPDVWTSHAWAMWWAESHGYGKDPQASVLRSLSCRRIEWRYLNLAHICPNCRGSVSLPLGWL